MPGNDETATRFAHAHISVYQSDTESTSQTSSVPIHLTGPVEGKNHYSENPPEVKQGDDIDHDVEFMSVIRALSSEIHRRGSNDSL